MYENGSRTTCSGFHRLHSESKIACGGGLWGSTLFACSPQPPSHTLSKYANTRVWRWTVGQHTLFACSPQPLSTRCQKKKKDSLTLLPQNHLDHFNNLHLDLWYRKMHVHPCCRLTPVSGRLHDFHQDL